MKRIIKAMEKKYLLPSLELVQKVFTEFDSPEEGKAVRQLVEEIRAKKYYIPELEFIMVDENDEIIGTGGIMEMDPIFSDLFMVEKIKSIRVGDEGLHMTCDAKVRQYRINDGNRKYYEYVDKQHLSIYMQPGTFSEEMLECLDKMYSNSEMITPD